jgi:hypothetical protein
MKRLIAAVSFAVLATPVLATPFEQTELDRALPEISVEVAPSASAGETRSDVEIAAPAVESSWENDHNFIAPAK